MKNNELTRQAMAIYGEITDLFRHFHMNPERSFQEFKTTETIKVYLEALGAEIRLYPGTTGLSAVIRGDSPGRVLALRADIDALPLDEETSVAFKSQNPGMMHACGHDAHMAILLGAAKLIAQNRAKMKGTVKLIFQPAEEISEGAKAIIEAGVMHDPDIDAAIALHVLPDVKSGHIQLKPDVIMSAQDEFIIEISGRGGHGSSPHKTIDPILAGAHLVTALQAVTSRKVNPVSPAVAGVCQFISGTKSNIIPEKALISGTIRTQDKETQNLIHEQIETITKGICLSFGASYTLKINKLLPMMVNDESIVRNFIACSNAIVDPSCIDILDRPYMYGEDFSYFAQRVPSMLFFLGTCNENAGCTYPLHSPHFKVDKEILPLGAALFANYCLETGG